VPGQLESKLNKWLSISISIVLLVALVVMGILYMGKSNNLKTANTEITTQKTTIDSLNKQLTTSKAETAALQGKLSASETTIVTLNGNITDLTDKNTKLTADLGTANTQLTSTQASLSSANSALGTAQSTNSTLSATVKKISDPKNFATVTELKDWLQKDDTNTKYTNLDPLQRGLILQIRAMRDGFILSLSIFADSTNTYVGNRAIIGDTVFAVMSGSDSVTQYVTVPAQPSHPEPLP
jgi:molybdopterin converting factor small subunit